MPGDPAEMTTKLRVNEIEETIRRGIQRERIEDAAHGGVAQGDAPTLLLSARRCLDRWAGSGDLR
jgi:hypothetical protein